MGIVMDDSAKSIVPIGDRVLLRFEEIKAKEAKSKTGLILPGKEQAVAGQSYGGSMGTVYRAYVEAVGNNVNMEKCNFNIGDWIIFNNMDVMGIDLPDPKDPTKVRRYGMTKPESIWGVYKE